MFGATTYLYDAEPKGGAFVFWPGSHRSTHKYFLQYPEQIDGSFYDIEDWGWHVLSYLSPEGPREFVGAAGDVVLWHAFLCHTGSANVKDVPRFGLFARYAHEKWEEKLNTKFQRTSGNTGRFKKQLSVLTLYG